MFRSSRHAQSMRFSLLVLSVLLLVVTVTCRPQKWNRPKGCLDNINECNPWKDECCDDLTCTNLRKGYCAWPYERCFCMNRDSFHVDQRSAQ